MKEAEIRALVASLTREEKVALLAGTNSWETNPVPRLGIPAATMADGPHGVRKQTGPPQDGVSYSEPSTSFPTAVTLASGWNADNIRRVGVAVARECLHHGVDVLLGPGVNIKRNPRAGRNFEYFSEDPLLSGRLATAFVQGVQSLGVGTAVKHFAANNQENYRYVGESVVDERALREIYFKPFEIVVKESSPWTIMAAYNRLWGEYCSENRRLLTDVLRTEWGFDGVVMSDWGGVRDRAQGVAAGLDLEMPGDTAYGRRRLLDALQEPAGDPGHRRSAEIHREPEGAPPREAIGDPLQEPIMAPPQEPAGDPGHRRSAETHREPEGDPLQEPIMAPPREPEGAPPREAIGDPLQEPIGAPLQEPIGDPPQDTAGNPLSEAALDEAVANVLRLVAKARASDRMRPAVDWDAHHRLAGEVAQDGAVLLQNDGTLPLDPNARLLVVGDFFVHMRYQGSGSSMVHPTRLTTPKDAFDARDVSYVFRRGYDAGETNSRSAEGAQLIRGAAAAAAAADVIVFFGGLPDHVETEAGDRDDIALPANQLAVLDALGATGKPVVVVLFGGGPVETPFADRVHAILNMYLPGQNGGEAAAALLFGEANPAGKLAETWPKTYGDVPFGDEYSTGPLELYKESVFVGYRFYVSAGKKPRWPFGHGLSYTTFSYGNVSVDEQDGVVAVTCDVTNDGPRAGAEIVQLYVQSPGRAVPRPRRELRAFDKLYLAPGETKRASLRFRREDLAYWHVGLGRWVLECGDYVLEIGASSEDIRLRAAFVVEGAAAAFPDGSRASDPASRRVPAKAPSAPGRSIPDPYPAAVMEVYGDLASFNVSDEVFAALLSGSAFEPGSVPGGISSSAFEPGSGSRLRPSLPAAPPPLPLTMESPFIDFRRTGFGRLVFWIVTSVPRRLRRRAEALPPGPERDNRLKAADFMEKIVTTSSPRSLTMAGPDALPYHWARAMVELGNGRLWGAVRWFFSPVHAPPLPKEK